MGEKIDRYTLKSGMVLLGEPLESVESAAFNFILPSGASVLPKGCCGAGNVIDDWIFRGAGDKDSRQLCDALDSLGLHRSNSVGSAHLVIGAVLEASNLSEAINLYSDIILRSRLEEEQFDLARQLAIDGVMGMDDDPRHKVMLKLKEQFYPEPLGRNPLGEIEELKALTVDKTKEIIATNFNLSQTIFTVAGKYDFDAVIKQIENLFETEERKPIEPVMPVAKTNRYTHIQNEGAQVHIGLMTETARPCDEDYYNARVAVSVLSGGMSARLFTEVREKRGLCYAIGASYHSLKEAAGVACYAGTTPDKAQETLDVVITEFGRLGEGISEEEIQRAKVGLKSALILQSESSSSRASGIGSDFHLLGRVRSLDEIKEKIEAISVDSVLEFLKKRRFKDFTVVTIGPKKIKAGQ